MASKKIRIVTDSAGDLTPEIIDRWNINVIPCYVNYGGQSFADDGVELDRAAYYKALPEMGEFPTTAAPPPALAEEILQEAIEGYDHVIAIHVAGKLSATVNNVRLAAQSLGDRVTVVDSDSVSVGLGIQALVAAEQAAAGNSAEEIIDAVDRVRQKHKLYAAFATMEYLRRSGRVSNLVAAVGSLLQIKPIVDVHDGMVDPAFRVRTFSKAISKLEELVLEQAPLERLIVIHIQNMEGALEFQESLNAIAPTDTSIMEIGPTVGTHIGPGSVGALTLPMNWRN